MHLCAPLGTHAKDDYSYYTTKSCVYHYTNYPEKKKASTFFSCLQSNVYSCTAFQNTVFMPALPPTAWILLAGMEETHKNIFVWRPAVVNRSDYTLSW